MAAVMRPFPCQRRRRVDVGALDGGEDEVRHEEGDDEGEDALPGAGDEHGAERDEQDADEERDGHARASAGLTRLLAAFRTARERPDRAEGGEAGARGADERAAGGAARRDGREADERRRRGRG